MENISEGSLQNPTYPIEKMSKLSANQLQALKDQWITTIDSFVATTATKEGRHGLCVILGIDLQALDELLQDARLKLGQKRYQDLLVSRPGGPIGVLIDKDE